MTPVGLALALGAGPARAQDGRQGAPREGMADLPVEGPPAARAPAPEGTAVDDTLPLPPSPDLTEVAGKPITRVEVVVDEGMGPTSAPVVDKVRAGEPMSPAVARRALQQALAGGAFASGRVSATPDGDGVRLLVRLVPRRLVDAVRLELHGAKVDKVEVLREAGLEAGGEITAQSLVEQRGRVARLLARRGYPRAVVSTRTRDTDDVLHRIVLVDIEPGPPLLVARRYFYVFGADPRKLNTLTATYGLDVGARADEDALAAADLALAARLHGAGYHRAAVSHDVVSADEGANASRSQAAVRVRIDTGPLFEVRFEGNDHYDTTALTGALALEEEGDRSGGRFVQRLEDFYRKRGFFDVEVTLETRGAETAPVRFLVFHVRENNRVEVVARAYPCFKAADTQTLDEGGPRTAEDIGGELDSFLEEDLPGADLFRNPDPQGLDRVLSGPALTPRGARSTPLDLDPYTAYVESTYERALIHVRDLYRNEGFLHGEVGPLQVVRRRCDPSSRPGTCVPLPLPPMPEDTCTYDATGVPLPVPPLPTAFLCRPDPSRKVECEAKVALRIPVKLGRRTMLYDLAFQGARSIAEPKLAQAAKLTLGAPASVLKLEEATRRVLEAYKEEGFAYADVRYTLEYSADHTQARVRFEVNEGDRVLVDRVIVEGNAITRESVIRRRIALQAGQPYRASDVRKTQERVATLGVFASVDVMLEDPHLPQKWKRVIVRVAERVPQYLEIYPSISTGEGIGLAGEYGTRNVGGYAIGIGGRVQLAHLPSFMIFNDTVRNNFDSLPLGERVVTRATVTAGFPDVGLGPLVRSNVDAVLARDLQRGFGLLKGALIASLIYRPVNNVQLSISQSAEYADVKLLGDVQRLEALYTGSDGSVTDPNLARILRIPAHPSFAGAQKFQVSWDRRDNAFSAHSGTFLVSGVEHVDSYALPFGSADGKGRFDGHFFRFTQTFSGYIPLPKGLTFAAQLRLGQIVHLFGRDKSRTYPDRLFYLGGIDSLRGFAQDLLAPQDIAETLPAGQNPGIRGGDLMINPRAELRIPVFGSFETVAFFDSGNVWVDPFWVYEGRGPFRIRTSAGSGIRWNSPIGIPVVFDVGFNLLPRSYEDRYAVQFALGVF